MASAVSEVHKAFYAVANADSTLKNSGVNPASGAARSVALVNDVRPNQPFPYARFVATSENTIEEETHDISQPTTKRVVMTVDVFSTYTPEVYSIANRLQALFQHRALSGMTGWSGTTWFLSFDFFTDSKDPNQPVQRGTLRFEARCQQT